MADNQPDLTKWPHLVDMSPDEAKMMRRSLELKAYTSLLAAFRAQGDISPAKKSLLQQLQKLLGVTVERHRAEVRKCTNDEKLSTCAMSLVGEVHDVEWKIEGRRAVRPPKSVARIPAAVSLANDSILNQAACNSRLEIPEETGDRTKFTAQPSTFIKPTEPVRKPISYPVSELPSSVTAINNSDHKTLKTTRSASPNTSIVTLPGGTSIHIKGGINLDDDEDITGAKRRRISTPDSYIQNNQNTTLTQTTLASNKSNLIKPSSTPMRITLNKVSTSHQINSPQQKVILVSNSTTHPVTSVTHKVTPTIPYIRTSTPLPNSIKTSITLPPTPGPTNHRTPTTLNTHRTQTPTITTINPTQSITLQRPRGKTVLSSSSKVHVSATVKPATNTSTVKPVATIAVSKPGMVIPVSSGHTPGTIVNRRGSAIHIKQEGAAMKIITSSSNKILPKSSSASIVVVTCTGNSSSTNKITTSPATSNSVSTIQTVGGKVISINTGKVLGSSVRPTLTTPKYVNPKGRPPMTITGQNLNQEKHQQRSNSPTGPGNVVIVQSNTIKPSTKSTDIKPTLITKHDLKMIDKPSLLAGLIHRNEITTPNANFNQSNSEINDEQESTTPIPIDIFSSALAEAQIDLDPYEFIDEDSRDSLCDDASSGLNWTDQTSQANLWTSSALPSSHLLSSNLITTDAGGTTTVSISNPLFDHATSLIAQASALLAKSPSQTTITLPEILPKPILSIHKRPSPVTVTDPPPGSDIPEVVSMYNPPSPDEIDTNIIKLPTDLIKPVTPIKPTAPSLVQPPSAVISAPTLVQPTAPPIVRAALPPTLSTTQPTRPITVSHTTKTTSKSQTEIKTESLQTTLTSQLPGYQRPVLSRVSPPIPTRLPSPPIIVTDIEINPALTVVDSTIALENAPPFRIETKRAIPTNINKPDMLKSTIHEHPILKKPKLTEPPDPNIPVTVQSLNSPVFDPEHTPNTKNSISEWLKDVTASAHKQSIALSEVNQSVFSSTEPATKKSAENIPQTESDSPAKQPAINTHEQVTKSENQLQTAPDLMNVHEILTDDSQLTEGLQPMSALAQHFVKVVNTSQTRIAEDQVGNSTSEKLTNPRGYPPLASSMLTTDECSLIDDELQSAETTTDSSQASNRPATADKPVSVKNDEVSAELFKQSQTGGDNPIGSSHKIESSPMRTPTRDSRVFVVKLDESKVSPKIKPQTVKSSRSASDAPVENGGSSQVRMTRSRSSNGLQDVNESTRPLQVDVSSESTGGKKTSHDAPSSSDDSLKENGVVSPLSKADRNLKLVISLKDNIVKSNGVITLNNSNRRTTATSYPSDQEGDSSEDDDECDSSAGHDSLNLRSPDSQDGSQRTSKSRKRRRKADPNTSWRKLALSVLKRIMVYRGPNRSKEQHGAAAWFLRPVTDDEAPGYSDVIDTPMDLGTVKRKLEMYQYGGMEEFNSDMMLIYTNCCTYNPPEHNVRKDCELVFIYYNQEYEKMVNRYNQALENLKKVKTELASPQ